MATKARGAVAAVVLAALAVFGITQIAGSSPGGDVSADSAGTPSDTPDPSATSTPSRTPTPTAESAGTPTKTPTPTPTPTEPEAMLAPGDEGDDVRDLQARLKQIAWYGPEINGEFDAVTEEAVLGFQAKRGYEATGEVDDQTWGKLAEMTREPTEDEKHNRLTPGPTIIGSGGDEDEIRDLQARLKQIGWFDHEVSGTYGDVTATAVSGFQRKRGFPETGEVDQRTWDRLAEMTRKPTDDEMHNRKPKADEGNAAGLDSRCLTGRVLCIDKTSDALRWVVDGEVRYTADVRFGCVGTPTREGQFDVYWKSRDHVSSLFDSEMPFAMFFDGGQAVHYSADFAAVGYDGCSHGCVNVRDYDGIAALFEQVRAGDKVVVYHS